MLNKMNVGIQSLKQKMVEIFPKDDVFNEKLFEVSTQSRDMKNQVTFKLKEASYKVFDPFMYVQPDQNSEIFRMYEQNGLRDKFVEEGVNDIVGDYLGSYSFTTPVNAQLQANLARSSISEVVVPLLVNWLEQ